MKPRITNEGLAAQIRELDGEGIVFSKFKMGNGDLPENYKTLRDLMNPIVDVGITNLEKNETEGYVRLEGVFNNSTSSNSFNWKEVGIFIKDPDDPDNDLLYAYGHVSLEENSEIAASIPAAGSEIYEVKLIYMVYIGEAENISAELAESSIYATKEEVQNHIEDIDNPHNVTKDQVGLGNVPNVGTDDQTPTVEISESLQEISNGDTMKDIVGKVGKAIVDLINHLKDTTKHITANERTTWNSKAPGSHNHSASDITSGVLGVARGGTGKTTLADLKSYLSIDTLSKHARGGYVKGQTYTKSIGGCYGYVSSNSTTAMIYVPAVVNTDVTTITITKAVANLRIATGGYLIGSDANLKSLITGAWVPSVNHVFAFRIEKSSGFGCANNIPFCGTVELTFKCS